MMLQSDPVLVAHGQRRREAVGCGMDPAFVSSTSFRLFELLGSDDLRKPMFKAFVDQLLEALYKTPGYIETLAKCADTTTAPLICWFLVTATGNNMSQCAVIRNMVHHQLF